MRLPRVRFTVRQMLVLVVVSALVSALVIQSIRAARRDRELARLVRMLNDASDRMQWAERMYEKGYVSKAQVEDAKVSFKRTLFELDPRPPALTQVR
jgi:hypothetical protein